MGSNAWSDKDVQNYVDNQSLDRAEEKAENRISKLFNKGRNALYRNGAIKKKKLKQLEEEAGEKVDNAEQKVGNLFTKEKSLGDVRIPDRPPSPTSSNACGPSFCDKFCGCFWSTKVKKPRQRPPTAAEIDAKLRAATRQARDNYEVSQLRPAPPIPTEDRGSKRWSFRRSPSSESPPQRKNPNIGRPLPPIPPPPPPPPPTKYVPGTGPPMGGPTGGKLKKRQSGGVNWDALNDPNSKTWFGVQEDDDIAMTSMRQMQDVPAPSSPSILSWLRKKQ